MACKHEELDGLYSNMNKMILEGLESYDKCVKNYLTNPLHVVYVVYVPISYLSVIMF